MILVVAAFASIVAGTFVGPRGTTMDSGAAVKVQTGAKVDINGGNFSGGKNNTLSAAGTLTVKGGTFDQNPIAFVADGCPVLQVGSVYYTNLTEALINEGFVRELISKVQTMRKEADFEVMDHIIVYVNGNAKLEELMKKNEAEIKSVVLADEVVTGSMDGISKEWNLNGEDVTIGVKRL